MIQVKTKDQRELNMISINIKNARYLLNTIYASDVENIKMNKIASRTDLVRFVDELESLLDSSSGTLTLTATMSSK